MSGFSRSFLLTPLLLTILTTGCASYTEETRQIRLDYMARSYDKALKDLESSGLKDSSNSKLLYLMEKGMILDRMGKLDASRKTLIEADKLADRLLTVSVSKTAASFVVNDAATDYAGEDYEKVAIHTQLALSFIDSGNFEAARVEARKINSKLAEINNGYDSNKNRYSEDAFARFLAGLIYEARGEWDSAIIDYSSALALYEGDYKVFVRGGVPETLVKALHALLLKRNRSDRLTQLEKKYPEILADRIAERTGKRKKADDGYGELAVVHEVGNIAVKVPEEFYIGVGDQAVRFSWPVIKKQSGRLLEASGVTIDGIGYVASENLQDMDAIAALCLEDRRLRMIAKQAARLLAKGQLTEQAYKNFGPIGGIAANVYSFVSETADTRGWTLLPEGYSVTRVRLKAGSHSVRIKTGGRQTKIETVTIQPGKVTIVRDVG